MDYKFVDKKSALLKDKFVSVGDIKNENISKQESSKELDANKLLENFEK